MIRPDPVQVAAIIREAAESEILPRFQTLGREQIREKKPGQLVTDADLAAERVLTQRLTALLPAAVVGEEGVHLDHSLLTALERPGPVWVIDPIDGTANFAAGKPRFAVIVALVVDGRTVMGWIHDPLPNRTVFAAVGEGAWQGTQRLRVAEEGPLEAMAGSVKRSPAVAKRVAKAMRLGSAAHDYLDLVCGGLDFAHFNRLMPWDHAAGVLIHGEAGGHAALFDRTSYRPVYVARGDLLMAPGPASWNALRNLLA